ncbi:MAG: Flp pilus assembly complex ATPase component TadA [Puniceicoccales bacterium]|jgi:type II secretory ATPase GspE/PulE/Tfp pilus assembly ATPase PilB-like protein|nr:Flp pilus assembly complex ATPase component TadA [Puniceicoccales bacterium]
MRPIVNAIQAAYAVLKTKILRRITPETGPSGFYVMIQNLLKQSAWLLLPLSSSKSILLVSQALCKSRVQKLEAYLNKSIVVRIVSLNHLRQWIQWHRQHRLSASNSLTSTNQSVHKILCEAQELSASDCYIQRTETCYKTFYRVRGALTTPKELSHIHGQRLLMSFLILAHLNLDKTGHPQEGHFRYPLTESSIFCRLSYIASDAAQSLALRLFHDTSKQFELCSLGMPTLLANDLKQMLKTHKSGMILLTGPTGSGKTTTLYSLIHFLAGERKKIITLEDPIEAEIEGAVQTEINENVGYDFAVGLKAVLRQDPDVIVVGEIRDTTAALHAFHACLSGYLVITTLHAKSLEEVPFRCAELGIEIDTFNDNILYTIHQVLKNSSPTSNRDDLPFQRQAVFNYKKSNLSSHCIQINASDYAGTFAVRA